METSRIFDVQALPSVYILEQDHNGENSHEVLSTHIGQQVMGIENEIEIFVMFLLGNTIIYPQINGNERF